MLGKQHGFYSDDALEAYNIDWAMETVNDHWSKLGYRIFLFKEDPSDEELKSLDD